MTMAFDVVMMSDTLLCEVTAAWNLMVKAILIYVVTDTSSRCDERADSKNWCYYGDMLRYVMMAILSFILVTYCSVLCR